MTYGGFLPGALTEGDARSHNHVDSVRHYSDLLASMMPVYESLIAEDLEIVESVGTWHQSFHVFGVLSVEQKSHI